MKIKVNFYLMATSSSSLCFLIKYHIVKLIIPDSDRAKEGTKVPEPLLWWSHAAQFQLCDLPSNTQYVL